MKPNIDSTVSVFDFATKLKITADVSVSMATLASEVWQSVNQDLEPRIQSFVDNMGASPSEIRLVEGVFMHDFVHSIFVLAKMRYYPDEPAGENYKVASGIFRLR